MENTKFIMTFLDTVSPLAQSTKFEVAETFGISAGVDEDDTCSESGDVFIKEHDLDATLVGRLYVDVVATVPTSPDLVDNICPTPLIHSMLSLWVHYHPLPLRVIVCHLLIIMICLRGM